MFSVLPKIVVSAQDPKMPVPGGQSFRILQPPLEERFLVQPAALDDHAVGSFDPVGRARVKYDLAARKSIGELHQEFFYFAFLEVIKHAGRDEQHILTHT